MSLALVLLVVPEVLWHLGKLHAVEKTLVWGLAFGPFLLLAVTIWVSRRREAAREPEDPAETSEPAEPAEATETTTRG